MKNLHTGGTVGSLIVAAIIRHADRSAIADGSVGWTYRELGDAIARFITAFQALGLKTGDALSILSSNRAESWAAMCAGLVMGMRYTPLHPLAAEDDHVFIIEDAEIDALIVEGAKFGDRIEAIKRRVPALKHPQSDVWTCSLRREQPRPRRSWLRVMRKRSPGSLTQVVRRGAPRG